MAKRRETPQRQTPPLRSRNAKAGPVKGIAASKEYDPGPPPPEQTNHDHPGAVGDRRSVPGAGVVGSDSDSPGATRRQKVRRPVLKAPGALRAGTTDSGPAGMPSGAGVGGAAGPLDNETPSDGGRAPLSVRGRNMGPPAGATSGETNDLDEPASRPRPRRGGARRGGSK